MAGAVTLVAILIVLGTLLTASVASEADLERLGAVTVVASIPELARRGRGDSPDLADTLAGFAFGSVAKPVLVGDQPAATEAAS